MVEFKLKARQFLNTPDRKRTFNRELFSAISKEYSGMSRLLSFGRDLAWKRRMIDSLPDMEAPQCADLACGPGDLTGLLAQKYPESRITGVDLAAPMLDLARSRFESEERIQFLEMDMTNTDFPDATIDLITVGYGIRNAPDLESALNEIKRLLKPGGLVAILDFSRWDPAWFSAIELALLRMWCGMWGLIRSGNMDTYGYIADSLALFPTRKQLHQTLGEHGFELHRTRRYFLGVIETIILERAVDVAESRLRPIP